MITGSLRARLGRRWLATPASALLFACIHWSAGPWAMVRAFLFGLLMQRAYDQNGSMLEIMAVHAVYDLISFW